MAFTLGDALVVRLLRALQLLFAIIVLGTCAYLAHWWKAHWHVMSPSQVCFLLFASVWTILVCVYLIVVPWLFSQTMMAHTFVIAGLEAVTMIFWFAGFIALAVWLSDRDCYGSVCSAARAGDVFAAFTWFLFAISTGLAVWHIMATHGRKSEVSHKEAPAMSVAESA